MNLIELGLATWRLSYMLVEEDGPGKVFRKLREASGIEYEDSGEVLSYNDYTPLVCVYCTSIWVAAGLLLAPSWVRGLLAASAIAIGVDKVQKKIPWL